MTRPNILCVATKTPGACRDCRHSNQGTVDRAEGRVYCAWDSRPRSLTSTCDLKVPLPNKKNDPSSTSEYYLFERFDGGNTTFGRREGQRLMPEDADDELRAYIVAGGPLAAR